MIKRFLELLAKPIIAWLSMEVNRPRKISLSSYERIAEEIKPCDILLVEGRTRISNVIRWVVQSPWTHAMIYIGKAYEIRDSKLKSIIKEHLPDVEPETPLIVESIIGRGVNVRPLSDYQEEHIRICRPKGLFRKDKDLIIEYVLKRLGIEYDVRHVFDLARFFIPWNIFPRRWRSTLFAYKPQAATRLTCPLLLAEAFASVHYPILPLVREAEGGGFEFIRRNPRLFMPYDFDFSPFFDIVKYPIVELSSTVPIYHNLPWNKEVLVSQDEGVITKLEAEDESTFNKSSKEKE